MPIAIVGLDARFGPWKSLRSFQERVLGGQSAEPQQPQHDWGVLESAWARREGINASSLAGFYVDHLEVAADRFRIPPRELQEALPQQVLMLQAADEALAQVHLSEETRPRTGVFIELNLDLNTTNYHFRWWVLKHSPEWLEASGPALNANRVMGALGSIAASRIARAFNLGGPSFTISSEETAALHCVRNAVRALQRGELDAALAGAVDMAGDIRALLAAPDENRRVGEGAAAVVLKRLEDAVRDGDTIYAVIKGIDAINDGMREDAPAEVGDAGAAAGMASFLKACVCLYQQVVPPTADRAARYWLRDRIEGSRRMTVGGRLVLEEWEPGACENRPGRRQPLGARDEALFVVEGGDAAALTSQLDRLCARLDGPNDGIEADARAWFLAHPLAPDQPLAVAFVANDRAELQAQIDWARSRLFKGETPPAPFRDRIFYSPEPLGRHGKTAFVYPGSGNDYPGMGRELAAQWPEILRRQDGENKRLRSQFVASIFWDAAPGQVADARQKIFAQVALAGLTTDLVRMFGVHPDGALGYSLGESAALFALRAWTGRDAMLQAMNASTLFAGDLTGGCDAARKAWKLAADEPVAWKAGLLMDRSVDEVRAALAGLNHVYLLIVNTPRECVIGGRGDQVAEAARRLKCNLLPAPETSTTHCSVAREVAEDYWRLHILPTTPPPNVRFYSTALGHSYELTEENAADAILAQALDTIDFPAVIEAAYRDGVRLFVEMGPGASCSRMIDAILGDRPHRARSVCAPGADGVSAVLRLLAMLVSERVAMNLGPLYGRDDAAAVSATTIPERTIAIPIGGEPFVVPLMARLGFYGAPS